MSDPKIFLDSNVFIYLVSEDSEKSDIAEGLLTAGSYVSVQVIHEIISVLRRKAKLDWTEIESILALIERNCIVVDLTKAISDRARALSRLNNINIYDACIVASAAACGCSVLATEDLNDGQVLAGVTIRNPFKL